MCIECELYYRDRVRMCLLNEASLGGEIGTIQNLDLDQINNRQHWFPAFTSVCLSTPQRARYTFVLELQCRIAGKGR